MRSSNLRAIAYERASSRLLVEFHTGHRYAYELVPENLFVALRSAGSKGRFFGQLIRDRFPYRRIR